MNQIYCDFCGTASAYFPVHGIMICSNCKSGIPEDEQDDQDLFDEEWDLMPSDKQLSVILYGIVLQS